MSSYLESSNVQNNSTEWESLLVPCKINLNRESWDRVMEEYQEYVSSVKDRRIILENKNDGKYLVLPYMWRGHPSYRKKVRKKLYRLRYLENKPFIHICLTMNPKNFDTIIEGNKMLSSAWHKLHCLLRKRVGKFDFIAVYEPHSDGRLHMHVLVFTPKKLFASTEELSKIWDRYGIGKIVWIKREWNRGNRVVKYVMKYLGKMMGDNGEWFIAMLWYLRKRQYTCSRGISHYMNGGKSITESEWEYIGWAYIQNIRICERLEEAIEMSMYVAYYRDRDSYG